MISLLAVARLEVVVLVVRFQSLSSDTLADLADFWLRSVRRRRHPGSALLGSLGPTSHSGDVDRLVLDDSKLDDSDLKLGRKVSEAKRVRGLCTRKGKLMRCGFELPTVQYLPPSPARTRPCLLCRCCYCRFVSGGGLC